MSTSVESALKKLNQREATQAALKNELLTRGRVDRLERKMVEEAKRTESVRAELYQYARRGFWGRLSWLLRGK